MRKIKYLFYIMLAMVFAVTLAACNEENEQGNEPVEITRDLLNSLVFENGVFDYDGEVKSIYVKDVPAGVEVSYDNNDKVEPGSYTVSAFLSYEKIKVMKSASLTINHLESVITAEDNQTKYVYGGNVYPTFTVNNTEQTAQIATYVVSQNGVEVPTSKLMTEGEYEVEIQLPKTAHYAAASKKVNVSVISSAFGLEFEDVTFEYDGTEKNISLNSEDSLPAGYTVEYENESATEAGDYYALAKIKDADGNVVETHAATLSILNPTNEEFDAFLDEFFVWYLEGDQLSVNILVENPENFGIEHAETIEWYTYSTPSDEDLEHDIALIREMIAELETYSDKRLSKLQEVTYRNIESTLTEMINTYLIKDALFMDLRYVDQFGGYVADFSTYMESYAFRCEQDVIDIIAFIQSTDEAFPSYLQFLSDRAEHGYALSNFTIREMRKYLEDILKDKEHYYLADVINAHIDEVEFLEAAEKEHYKDQVSAEMVDSYMVGVQALYDGLANHLDVLEAGKEGYLAVYEHGKELYMSDLQALLGLNDFDPQQYIMAVEAMLKSAGNKSSAILNNIIREFKIASNEELNAFIDSKLIFDGTPDEMMEYLKEFAPTIVPELKTDPDIVIKNMDDASAKVSNANAYYMKSPVDNTGAEEITLNHLKLDVKNDLLSTLAHEGYPGHLYAYVYSKEIGQHEVNTIMTSTAHAEGWATYVQLKLFEYAKSQSNDKVLNLILDYMHANQMSGFLLETRIDFGIHYEGWTVEKVGKYLKDNGYNESAAQEIYDLIIEMPTTYAAYGYGKLMFVQLHEEAQALLGGHYNEIEFNAMLLSRGWSSLGELENTYNEYMKIQCHKYGIEFTER